MKQWQPPAQAPSCAVQRCAGSCSAATSWTADDELVVVVADPTRAAAAASEPAAAVATIAAPAPALATKRKADDCVTWAPALPPAAKSAKSPDADWIVPVGRRPIDSEGCVDWTGTAHPRSQTKCSWPCRGDRRRWMTRASLRCLDAHSSAFVHCRGAVQQPRAQQSGTNHPS